MTFYANSREDASKVKVEFLTVPAHEREEEIRDFLKEVGEGLADKLGGYLVLTVTGHVNADSGQPGDNINLQVSSTIAPGPPVKDVGADAAMGSPRLEPPDASTAAPVNEGLASPTPQPPVPLPDPS